MKGIEISVFCLAYNCVKFIEKSIHGMLRQNVNAGYKIIIHDDASTDGTADIIKMYAKKYPSRICAIIQPENRYSQGIDIYREYIEPKLEGKYIAICEGDDCWTDENKLQRQYDYMEKHPECSLCAHNTGKAKMFHDWKKIHILTEEEVFLQWKVHTSSFFMRRNAVISVEKRFWFGDYMVLTQAFSEGQVAALPHVMSTYHCNNPNGVLRKINNLEMEEKIKKERARIEYLREFNIKTQFRYDEIIQARCKSIDYYCLQIECDYIILHSGSKSLSRLRQKRWLPIITTQNIWEAKKESEDGLGDTDTGGIYFTLYGSISCGIQ